MYYLNLNKKTNRVLSASLLFNETSMPGSVKAKTLPDGNLYDYLYVNGEFVYSPIKKEGPVKESSVEEQEAISVCSDEQPDFEQRISSLENSIATLAELVNSLIEQNK